MDFQTLGIQSSATDTHINAGFELRKDLRQFAYGRGKISVGKHPVLSRCLEHSPAHGSTFTPIHTLLDDTHFLRK